MKSKIVSQTTENIEGSLGNYSWQETEDGSLTLYSHHFNEACHSHAGAYEETLFNYIHGTGVPKRYSEYLKNGLTFTIFEVGFGTGLGLKATLEVLKQSSGLHFISCELDKKLTHNRIESLLKEGQLKSYQWQELNTGGLYEGDLQSGGKLTILVGDIRKVLPNWATGSSQPQFNSIFQDAFSPKRNPSLWTKQWFNLLGSLSSQDCILGTYSSTKAMWKALLESDWRVQEVTGHGQKKLSTRAYRMGDSSAFVLDQCKRSPIPTLCDSLLLESSNPLT